MEQDHILEIGEVLLEKVRKHWMVYMEDFLLHIFGCLLFIVPAAYLTSIGFVPFLTPDDMDQIAMVLVIFVLLFWASFFYFWTKSYFDVWYVTNRHIIAINQKQIFEREEAFMELNRIQDVFFEKNGFLQTFLGYGVLKVQSAGTEQEFVIENVRDVEAIAHRIMELRDTAKVNSVVV